MSTATLSAPVAVKSQRPSFRWSKSGECLNPASLMVYKKGERQISVQYAYDQETGKWFSGFKNFRYGGGGMLPVDRRFAHKAETKQEAIRMSLDYLFRAEEEAEVLHAIEEHIKKLGNDSSKIVSKRKDFEVTYPEVTIGNQVIRLEPTRTIIELKKRNKVEQVFYHFNLKEVTHEYLKERYFKSDYATYWWLAGLNAELNGKKLKRNDSAKIVSKKKAQVHAGKVERARKGSVRNTSARSSKSERSASSGEVAGSNPAGRSHWDLVPGEKLFKKAGAGTFDYTEVYVIKVLNAKEIVVSGCCADINCKHHSFIILASNYSATGPWSAKGPQWMPGYGMGEKTAEEKKGQTQWDVERKIKAGNDSKPKSLPQISYEFNKADHPKERDHWEASVSSGNKKFPGEKIHGFGKTKAAALKDLQQSCGQILFGDPTELASLISFCDAQIELWPAGSAEAGVRSYFTEIKRRLLASADHSGNDVKENRFCACGCGEQLTGNAKMRFVNSAHRLRAWKSQQRADTS